MFWRALSAPNFSSACAIRWYAGILLWLLFLTVVSLHSDFQTAAPFDARTGEHIDGLSLAYPTWGAVIEPFAALAQMLAGAPDMRKAVVSFLVWAIFLPFVFALWRDLRGTRQQARRSHYQRAARFSFYSVTASLVYFAFIITVPMPTWSLQDQYSDDVSADLHTHTFLSHDGLVSPQDNFQHHRDIGDQVVVFSDHGLRPRHYDMNNVISGIELGVAAGDLHIIGIGVDPDKFDPVPLYGLPDLEVLVYQIHDVHNGAVIAMSEHLRPEDVKKLVDLGIDGFEIFNEGYTPPDQPLRDALLEAQRTSGVALVADSDWHGWTTLNEQWNVFRAAKSNSSADVVVGSIRDHHGSSVYPVTAHHPGQVSLLHNIFSPLFEAYRYAGELNHLRLASWWMWGVLLMLLVRSFETHSIDPTRGLAAALLLPVGASIFIFSFYRLASWLPFGGINGFGRDLFLVMICISALCIVVMKRVGRRQNLLNPACQTQASSLRVS